MRRKIFSTTKQNVNRMISLLLVLVIAFSHAMMLKPVFADENDGIFLIGQESSKSSNTTFGKKISREKFESINFVDNIDIIEYALDSWDAGIDEYGNTSDKIKAWYTDFEGNGLYELYIGQKGGVIANQDSSFIFEGFSNVKYINIENLRFENTTNIESMFEGDSKLETIYVSSYISLDNVIKSQNVFKDCTAIIGENGTEYDANIIDSTYARIDNKDGMPGYFTEVVNDIKEISPLATSTKKNTAIIIKESTNNITLKKSTMNLLKSGSPTRSGGTTAGTKTITVTKIWDDDDLIAERPDDLKVYLKAKVSQFLPGTELNSIMETLAGDNLENITAFKRASTLNTSKPYEIVTTGTSSKSIYMWYDSGTIYYYSESEDVFLNENSSSIFKNMTNITDISGLVGLDTTMVKDFSRAFANCKSLADISPVAGINVKNVTTLEETFQNCISITDLSPVSGWDTSNVQNMRFTFGSQNANVDVSTHSGGMQFTSLMPLSTWNTSNVTSLQQTFKGATNLTNLNGLENWDVSLVTDMAQMFERCYSITNIDAISDWNVVRISNSSTNVFSIPDATIAAELKEKTFTNRPGTWNVSAHLNAEFNAYGLTYSTTGKLDSVDPTYTYHPHEAETTYESEASGWTKNGNTWTYTFEVNDEYDYYGYEDVVPKYISDALISNPKDVVGDELIINNTFDQSNIKKVTITKVWDDENELLRPNSLTFTIKNSSDIPADYQQVEYIRTEGGYIETDIQADASYTIYGDGNTIGAGFNGSIIDAYTNNTNRTGNYMLTGSAATPNLRWQIYWIGTGAQQVIGSSTGIDMTKRYQFTQNSSGITITQGEASYTKTYSAPTTGTLPNYRLGGNIQNNRNQVYFYNAKIYNSSGTLLHDFIPVYKKADGKIGVYDIVGEKYYPGTGTIVKGADVAGSSSYSTTKTISADKWTKSGNNWTAVVAVDNNAENLTIYEHDVEHYTSDATEAAPKDIESNAATVTNTTTKVKIEITKEWNDDNNLLGERLSEDNFDIYLNYKTSIGREYSAVDLDTTWSGWEKDTNTWVGTIIVDRLLASDAPYAVYEDGTLGEYTTDAPQTAPKQVTGGRVTVTNTFITKYNLEIKKEITGTLADLDKEFSFNIKVYDGDNNVVTGNFVVNENGADKTYTATNDGFDVKLSAAGLNKVVVKDIRVRYTYQVSETGTDYTEYYKIVKTADNIVIKAQTEGLVASGTLTENQTVTFTNNKELSPLTGLMVESGPYAIMIIMVLIVVGIYIYDGRIKVNISKTIKDIKIKDINHIAKHIKTSIFTVRLFNIRKAKRSK